MAHPTRWFGRGNTRALIISAGVLALFVTPLALAQSDGATGRAAAGEGDPLEGGVRNPSTNRSQELERETQIIANTNSYGTRQSNKSNNGGGAIYGCRSGAGGTPANNEPCIRANNLEAGLAFEFDSDGAVVGTITSQSRAAKPFTTNANGVADGLNADRVDSLDAAQIVAQARQTEGLTASDAQELGGQAPAAYTTRWALVGEDGDIISQSGGFDVIAAYPPGNDNVYIDVGEDVRNRGLSATIAVQNSVATQADSFGGQIAVGACGSEAIACAPDGTEEADVIVVTPRGDDGGATSPVTRKRFYVEIAGTPSS